jgi:hypothetical protein
VILATLTQRARAFSVITPVGNAMMATFHAFKEMAVVITLTRGMTDAPTNRRTIRHHRLRPHRTENLCVNALAGAAKTTTLEMICHAVDNIPILSLAFNKRIADELSKRLPAHVECRTFNSLGHRVWAQACGRRLTLEPNKMHSITKRLIEDLPRSRQSEAWEDFADTLRWLRYAKRDGYVPQDWEKLPNVNW